MWHLLRGVNNISKKTHSHEAFLIWPQRLGLLLWKCVLVRELFNKPPRFTAQNVWLLEHLVFGFPNKYLAECQGCTHLWGELGRDTLHSSFWIKLFRFTRLLFWENLEAWLCLWAFFFVCAHQTQGTMWMCLLIVIIVEKRTMAWPELYKGAFQFRKVMYRPQQRSCLLKLISF